MGMLSDKNKILLQKYLSGNLTEVEKALLIEEVERSNNTEFELLADYLETELDNISLPSIVDTSLFAKLQGKIQKQQTDWDQPLFYRNKRYWIAASLIFLVGIGMLISKHLNNFTTVDSMNEIVQSTKIIPGTEGAILTLADGSILMLDSLNNGLVTEQSGTKVLLQNGRLAYKPTGEETGEVTYNTMSTPNGRQFSLTLPDGTQVWLNAASSVRYPTVFTGKERRVEVVGEVYFEVAKNTNMPFRVNVQNKAEVEVLGTDFNVNAYDNEVSINTTLVQGSVKVNGTIIQPGQQAQIMVHQPPPSIIKVVNHVDITKVVAWKNGFINFDGETFEAIMRQLERWYDIEVVYENGIVPNKKLAGKMTRGVSFDGLLKNLKKLGVHYKLNDRTLTVLH